MAASSALSPKNQNPSDFWKRNWRMIRIDCQTDDRLRINASGALILTLLIVLAAKIASRLNSNTLRLYHKEADLSTEVRKVERIKKILKARMVTIKVLV